MFFKRRRSASSVAEGARFERLREHNIVEQATVVWVGEDPFGIPHVRFKLKVPAIDDAGETRILAVNAFTELYRPCGLSAASTA